MTLPALNMIKLCVGADSVQDLADWHLANRDRWPKGQTIHITRMWPKRSDDLLAGGSLYWVIRREIIARQRIIALQPHEGGDGITRCAIVLDADIIRTAPAARRPFQGWRYLQGADAPPDLTEARPGDDDLPPDLALALSDLGLR